MQSQSILASYFVVIKKLILKFMWKGQRTKISNTIKKVGLTPPSCKATVIKIDYIGKTKDTAVNGPE